MLDLARLQRSKLTRRPLYQRLFGQLLGANYGYLPGVEIVLENSDRIPDRPVIYAMNHTDRYNYFPFQYVLWKRFDRFTATWVKGKYYENRFVVLREPIRRRLHGTHGSDSDGVARLSDHPGFLVDNGADANRSGIRPAARCGR